MICIHLETPLSVGQWLIDTTQLTQRVMVPHDFEFRNEDADLAIFRRPYYDERIPGA